MRIITTLIFSTSLASFFAYAQPPQLTVPASALSDLMIEQAFGGRGVQSDSFEKWLIETGVQGELAALTDQRQFDELSKSNKKDLAKSAQQDEEPYYLDEIRFIAYQLLADKYQVEPLLYRKPEEYNTQLLEKLIQQLRKGN